MPPKKPTARAAPTDPAVDALLAELDHPLKPEIDTLRRLILGVSPGIHEELKWNSPSFRTTEHFATINFRAKDCLRLVLHLGAKRKSTANAGIPVHDPAGLLEWPAKDRAIATFRSAEEIEAGRADLETVLRQWLRHL